MNKEIVTMLVVGLSFIFMLGIARNFLQKRKQARYMQTFRPSKKDL